MSEYSTITTSLFVLPVTRSLLSIARPLNTSSCCVLPDFETIIAYAMWESEISSAAIIMATGVVNLNVLLNRCRIVCISFIL